MSIPIYDPNNDNPVLAFAFSEHAYNDNPIYWRFPMTVDEVEQLANKPQDTAVSMWGPTHLVCVSGDITMPNVEVRPCALIMEWLALVDAASQQSVHAVYTCHPQSLLGRLAFWRSLRDKDLVPTALRRPVNLVELMNNPNSVLTLPERKNFTMYNSLRWILPLEELQALIEKRDVVGYAAHLYRVLFQRLAVQNIQ